MRDQVKRACIEFYKVITSTDYAKEYIKLKEVDYRLTKIREGEIVLDVGCGKPVDAIWFSSFGSYYIGVDISSKELMQGKYFLRELFPKLLNLVDFIMADTTRLPFRDDVFDISVSYSAIEHAPTSLRKSWISEMARVTKIGGEVVITLQNKLSLICYLFLPFRVIDFDALPSPKILSLLAQYVLYWLSKVFSSLSFFLILRTDYHEDFVTPAELFDLVNSHRLCPTKFDASPLYYWG